MRSDQGPKFKELVVHAIRRLQATQGSTLSEIAKYMSTEYDIATPELKRQIQMTLRQGLNCGVIEKSNRGYITCERKFYYLDDEEPGECALCRPALKGSTRIRSSKRMCVPSRKRSKSPRRVKGQDRGVKKRGRAKSSGRLRAASRTKSSCGRGRSSRSSRKAKVRTRASNKVRKLRATKASKKSAKRREFLERQRRESLERRRANRQGKEMPETPEPNTGEEPKTGQTYPNNNNNSVPPNSPPTNREARSASKCSDFSDYEI